MSDFGVRRLKIDAKWDKPVVSAAGGQAALMLRISAGSAPLPSIALRPAVNVAFALDCSGSMTGAKLDLAKRAAATAIGKLRPKDWAGLVAFDSSVHHVFPMTGASAANKRVMTDAVARIHANSATNLSGGWLEAADGLAGAMAHDHNKGRVRRTILLTDGQANNGITSPNELAMHASALRRRGISTTTLGIGNDFDEVLLSSMAEEGGGNFQFIEHPNELPAFFEREMTEMLSVAAPALSLSLRVPPGARVELINPFPVDIAGGRTIISLGDLAANDEITLIFLVDLPPAPIGAEHTGYVNARWFNHGGMANVNQKQALAGLRWTSPAEAEARPADPEVLERAALQRVHVEQREAMRLDREGRHGESRERLSHARDLLSAAPASPRVRELHAEVNELADADAAIPFTESTRKRSTSDAFRRSRKSER